MSEREEREAGMGLLRPEDGEAAHRVTFVEVFFDVVFIFAFTQLSSVLAHDPGWMALAETLVLTIAIWWVWVDTTWLANALNPEKWPVRALLLTLMGLGLVLASAIPHSFSDEGWVFAVAIVAIGLVRTGFAVVAFRRADPDSARVYLRVLVWTLVRAPLWLIGGFGPPETRLLWWTAAVALEILGPLVAFHVPGLGHTSASEWSVTGAHMAERVGLFFIIAIGESIIVTGSVFTGVDLSTDAIGGFAAAFIGSILLWMLYFNHSERGGKTSIEEAEDDEEREAGSFARTVYTLIPIVMIAGLVIAAVSDELVILGEQAEGWTRWLICLGPALYLAGTMLFKRAIGLPWLVSHAVAIVALLVLGPVSAPLAPVTVSWIVCAILAAVVVADEVMHRRGLRATGSED